MLAAYLKDNGRYSNGGGQTDVSAGHSAGRLTTFLQSAQIVGDDEQYAAAMALLANAVGVPARVSLDGTVEPDGSVYGRDVRADVELQLDPYGWVTLPAGQFVGTRHPTPQPHITTPPPAPAKVVPPRTTNSLPVAANDQSNAVSRSAPAAPKPNGFRIPALVIALLADAGLPLLILAAIAAALTGAKAFRRRRRRGGPPVAQAIGAPVPVLRLIVLLPHESHDKGRISISRQVDRAEPRLIRRGRAIQAGRTQAHGRHHAEERKISNAVYTSRPRVGIFVDLRKNGIVRGNRIAAALGPVAESIARRSAGKLRRQQSLQRQAHPLLNGDRQPGGIGDHLRLATGDRQAGRVGVDPVHAFLEEVDLPVLVDYGDRCIRALVPSIHNGGASLQFDLSVAQIARDHANRALLAHAEEDARGKQHLRPAFLRAQFGALGHAWKSAEMRFQRQAGQINIPVEKVDQTGMGGDHRLCASRNRQCGDRGQR